MTVAGVGGGQQVGFTVRRTMLVVVDASCRPLELWANFTGRASTDDVRAATGRRSAASGSTVSLACTRSAMATLRVDRLRWTTPGEIWAQ